VLLFSCALILFSGGSVCAGEKLVLQFPWHHQFQFAGYYMAKELGYYERAGIEVEIRSISEGGEPVAEVLSGRADFGVAGSGLLVERALGKPVVVVASIFQHAPTIFLTLEQGITKPTDLIGKRVMLSPGFQSLTLIALLHQEGVLDKIERLDTSFDFRSLLTGETDVFNAYRTNEPFLLKSTGYTYNSIDPEDYGIDFYGDTLFTSESFIKDRGDLVDAFRLASLRGWEYALAHPEEAIEVIRGVWNVEKSVEHLRFESKAIRKSIHPELIPIGTTEMAKWAKIAHYLIATGHIKPGYFINTNFLYQPSQGIDWVRLRPWLVGVTSLIVGLLIFLSVLYRTNRRLRLTEQKVRQSERKLRDALDAVSDGVWDWNVLTGEATLDARSKELFGFDPKKDYPDSLKIFALIDPEDIPAVKAAIHDHIEGKTDKYDQSFRVHSLNGEVRWLRGRGRVIERDSADQALRLIGTNTDITEQVRAEQTQRELEEQLRQKYKMEAVGTMAGGIAHDFNNHLAIILGNVEMAALKLPDGSPAGRYIEKAKTAANRSREVISQILLYSRRDLHNLKPVRLSINIKETLSLLHSTTPKSVEIRTTIAKEAEPLVISADPTQLQQILINLFRNAVYAIEEKGLIRIELDSRELVSDDFPPDEGYNPGIYLVLSVEDSGKGMSPEIQRKIFDPFFTTKGVNKGTGMGLSVVQGIVKSHEGFIRVNSMAGQGTRFEIYFPTIEQEVREDSPSETPLPSGCERILVLDDEEDLALLYSQMLSEHGYQVTTETSSERVIKMFADHQQRYDLLITDQTMPGILGTELAEQLQKIQPELPIILCTGYSDKVSAVQAKKIGIQEFCMKPLNLRQLLETTRTVLDLAGIGKKNNDG
jgi:PAS domain S-box-containing protein